ncbi:MAG: oligosaccharide flippase family protein, partial [Dehalococcoidales bacterium]|nr:oligosaccharide flippase family protein [Dehalococcoidales bacterium]
MENSYQKFAKDVLIIGITNLLVALSALILLPLLSKTIGAQGYGIWAQVDVTIQLVIGIVGLSLPFALSRFLAAETDRGKLQDGFYSAFTMVALATLAASILLIVASKPVAAAFFAGATQIVVITGLIILVWSLDLMFLGLFRARRQMRSYGIFMTATRYLEVGLIAYFVLNGHGILSAILCLLAVRTLTLLALFFFTKSQIGIKRPRFSNIREYLSFSLPTIPGVISAWVVTSSDRYIIG